MIAITGMMGLFFFDTVPFAVALVNKRTIYGQKQIAEDPVDTIIFRAINEACILISVLFYKACDNRI